MKRLILLLFITLQAGCTSWQYHVKNDKVLFGIRSWNHAPQDYSVEGADLASFRELNDGYALDKAHVYYKGDRIEKADPATFQILKDGYSKDRSRVFLLKCALPAANPQSFVQLQEYWSKDKERVYQGYSIIPGAKPSTFRVLREGWAIDRTTAFFHIGMVSVSCDPTDSNIKLHIVENVDPNTFEVIEAFRAKDSRRTYDVLKMSNQ